MITPSPPHHHKHKTVFEMSVKLPRCDKVLPELTSKLIGALSFIRQYANPTAAILPKSDPTKPHITTKISFPTIIFPLEADYFVFATSSWHYAPKAIQGKIIRMSVIIGSDVPPDTIALCRPDLNTMGVGFEIKAHQNIDTNTRITLLGAPNTISKTDAKKICITIYQSALQSYKTEHEDDPLSLATEIPDFAITLGQPQGLPFVRNEGAVDKYIPPPKERRSLHIMCSTSDFEVLAKLTEHAKTQDLWRPSFGMCYPTIAPQIDCDEDRLERYVQMVNIHESVQRCYANTVVSGLCNVDKEFTLRKDDGNTATFTARQLLSHIKVYDPVARKTVPVFLCLLRRDDLRYHAYFPGGNEEIRAYVEAFRRCPGPQLYFYLLKRRFLLGDVSRFIRSAFNLEQQTLCSRAKYNKATKMAVVPNIQGQMDIIDAVTTPGSGFAIDTVMRSPALQPLKYSGPNNNAVDYYDFADGQSLTTIKSTTMKKTADSSDSVKSSGIGKSVYEPDGSAAVSQVEDDDMDVDEDDSIGDDSQRDEFVFDLDALKEIERTTLATYKTTCDRSATSSTVIAPTQNYATMSEADSRAIQEQLTLTLVSQHKESVALQLGEEQMELDIPENPNFAVVLEEVTGKNYSTMLEIINSISEAIPTTHDEDKPSTEIPTNIQHHLFTQALYDALKSDLLGSEESLAEYLECMTMAIESAQQITDDYMTDTNDAAMEQDNTENTNTSLPPLPASESNDTAAKLQGCAEDTNTNTTIAEAIVKTGIDPSGTSRLGADQE